MFFAQKPLAPATPAPALGDFIFYLFFAQKPIVGAGGAADNGDREGDSRKIYLTAIFEKKEKKSRNLFKFVSVILCALVERVGVSRMRDFFYMFFLFMNHLKLKDMGFSIISDNKDNNLMEPF